MQTSMQFRWCRKLEESFPFYRACASAFKASYGLEQVSALCTVSLYGRSMYFCVAGTTPYNVLLEEVPLSLEESRTYLGMCQYHTKFTSILQP